MTFVELLFTVFVTFIVLFLVALLLYYVNRIIVYYNTVDNAWAQIDVQLKKRADLVPNLVETVKGYMAHEKDAIRMVTEARERMLRAGDAKERIKAEGELTTALKTIFAISENYPALRASENFKLLQEQLDGIESKIAYARQFYNDSVLRFNNAISTVPGRWFARLLGKTTPKEFFGITEEEKKPVKVEF